MKEVRLLMIKELALTGVMLVALAGPVYAQSPSPTPRMERGEKVGTLGKLLKAKAAVGSGTLTAVSGTTLTVTKDGKTYTVLTDSKTQFRRKFWGKGTLSEMQVNDMVNVIGQWTDDAKTTVQAKQVRDLSLQRRRGVFVGTVQSLSATGWVMQAESRGVQTVTVSSSSKFVNRKGAIIAQGDIKVGDKVRVNGLWDKTAGTITEVTQVKDYNLPKAK